MADGTCGLEGLLGAALHPPPPGDGRMTAIRKLAGCIAGQAGPRRRQAMRYLLLRAAAIAGNAEDDGWRDMLTALAADPAFRQDGDWLATPKALQVLPMEGDGWKCRFAMSGPPVDPAVLADIAAVGVEDVGPGHEQKYRVADIQAGGGFLDVILARSSWQEGKGFHVAVRKNPGRFLHAGSRTVVPLPLGDARLPGLAVAHCILLTADRQLLMAQRSARVAYAPLHWSASFEEQVTAADLSAQGVFERAAARGAAEEFGIRVPPENILLLSMMIEMDSLNLAAAVLVRAPQTLRQIIGSWSGDPRPADASEAASIAAQPLDPAQLAAMAAGSGFRLGPLHPTSALRCGLLAEWLRAGA